MPSKNIEPPPGWGILPAHEVIQRGDRYIGSNSCYRDWYQVESSIGMRVDKAMREHPGIVAYCRELELEPQVDEVWTGEWIDADES